MFNLFTPVRSYNKIMWYGLILRYKLTYSAFVSTLDRSEIVNALVNDNKASQIIITFVLIKNL